VRLRDGVAEAERVFDGVCETGVLDALRLELPEPEWLDDAVLDEEDVLEAEGDALLELVRDVDVDADAACVRVGVADRVGVPVRVPLAVFDGVGDGSGELEREADGAGDAATSDNAATTL
jgi:hypothetical protein